MPLHDYECRSCGHVEERFVKLADMHWTQFCSNCFVAMKRLMPAPRIQMDYQGYNCPITGKWVEGRRAHEENLRKHNCRILESGEHEANLRRREQEAEALENRIAESAAMEVASWPAEKQSKLIEEVGNGLDLTYQRMGA
jgi:putative FmdB family regulatory protein